MKLKRELLNFRRMLIVSIVALSIASNFFDILALEAWLCFLILIVVYLFDIVFHSVRPLFTITIHRNKPKG